MMGSLKGRLFLGLGAFILIAALCAGSITFSWAYDEALEVQDAMLLQVGALAASNRVHSFESVENGVDKEARVVVEELQPEDGLDASAPLLLPLPAAVRDGLQTVGQDPAQWRVLVRTRTDGSRVAIGQLTGYRDEIARGSALRTVVPFAILVPCLMLLVGLVLRYSFRSVAELASELDASDHDTLAQLPLEGVPTELRPFVGSINSLLRRITAMLDHQRRFVADAAHELRSPITALSVQAENLDSAELPEESRSRLAALQRGIRRIAHLLEQLLALAKYETPLASEAQVSAFDHAARNVVAILLPAADARGIDLGFEEIESVMVRVDATALGVLVRNLVDNALRHSPDGRRVDIHLFAQGPSAILCVEDEGPGICEVDLPRIFEPFYRGRHSSGLGSGLGLSIVHRIATGAGGTVSVANIPPPAGPGLRVIVAIPLATFSGARAEDAARGDGVRLKAAPGSGSTYSDDGKW